MGGSVRPPSLAWCYVPCPARGPHQHQASKHLITIVTLTHQPTTNQPILPTYLPTRPITTTTHQHHTHYLLTYLLTYLLRHTYIHTSHVCICTTDGTYRPNQRPTNQLGCELWLCGVLGTNLPTAPVGGASKSSQPSNQNQIK